MAKNKNKGRRTPADWITDKLLRGIISGLSLLPYAHRVRLMGALTEHVIGPIAGYRTRVLNNLSMIDPSLDRKTKRAIAAGVLNNTGRTLIENYSGAEFGDHLQNAEIIGDGLDAVKQAHAENRPVLFVTGHFGNHEAPRQVLTRMGYSIGGLYRPMKNAYFNEHYAKTMTEMSGPVFAQGKRGTGGFARHLRSGGMGTLLFDVAVRDGAMIDFLGKPARTATSAASIALRSNALLVPYFGIRQPDGLSFKIAVETPIEHSDPETMTTELTRRLEKRIAANPEQWFWVHRRWKEFS